MLDGFASSASVVSSVATLPSCSSVKHRTAFIGVDVTFMMRRYFGAGPSVYRYAITRSSDEACNATWSREASAAPPASGTSSLCNASSAAAHCTLLYFLMSFATALEYHSFSFLPLGQSSNEMTSSGRGIVPVVKLRFTRPMMPGDISVRRCRRATRWTRGTLSVIFSNPSETSQFERT